MPAIRFSSEKKDIIDINMRSACAKDGIMIIELSNMNGVMSWEDADRIRSEFIKNQTPIRQITNYSEINLANSIHQDGMEKLMEVHYIPKDVFSIENEILIFWDTVAMYRVEPDLYYIEIEDVHYASMMRGFFENLWKISEAMFWTGTGWKHAKQYTPFNMDILWIPAVIYPARDDGDITQAFARDNPESMREYLTQVLDKYQWRIAWSDMLIMYVWNDGTTPMVDVWKVMRNTISDDSGFLYDGFTLRDSTIETSMWTASGNSLIVFTAEELLLRKLIMEDKKNFRDASDRTLYMPSFPKDMVPSEGFFIKQ